jgi:hypothetical protein
MGMVQISQKDMYKLLQVPQGTKYSFDEQHFDPTDSQ